MIALSPVRQNWLNRRHLRVTLLAEMPEPAMTAGNALRQGRALVDANRFREAIELLRPSAAMNPHDLALLCTLAQALMLAGQTREAIAVANSAAALVPPSDWPLRILSEAHLRDGRPKEACEAALAAQHIDPKSVLVLEAVADAQLSSGHAREARETATLVIDLAPNSANGYDIRGRAALKLKKYGDAEHDFREALHLQPANWVYNNNLGVALRGQKRDKAAVDAFEKALKANPRSGVARNNLVAATSAYVAAGSILVLLLVIRVLPTLLQRWNLPARIIAALVIAAIIATIGGGWLWRRYRRRQLSGTVDRIYQEGWMKYRTVQLIRTIFRVGPIYLAVAIVVVVGLSRRPALLPSVVAGLAFVAFWRLYWLRLWRRFLLPHLRAADAPAQ
jgi:tetratricopeptide (TPR) repeat protein